jgi:hypothetical protein
LVCLGIAFFFAGLGIFGVAVTPKLFWKIVIGVIAGAYVVTHLGLSWMIRPWKKA